MFLCLNGPEIGEYSGEAGEGSAGTQADATLLWQ